MQAEIYIPFAWWLLDGFMLFSVDQGIHNCPGPW